jgi:hypothetical protein
MTTARDVMEQATYAALARHTEAIANHTWRVTADNTLVDHVLRTFDRLVERAVREALARREATEHAQREAAVRPLVAAVRSVRSG